VTTKGGSVLEAVRAVREQGAIVEKVITVVDRIEGAAQNLANEKVKLVPVFTTRELLA
jgi:orotate phosphoribosyltransferase